MNRFVDRKEELEKLEKEYKSNRASFVVIYGRRRVGKTSLIRHFCEGKRVISYLASEENITENRNAFKNVIAEFTGNELLKEAQIHDWGIIFREIKKEAEKEKLILVIDEFQYLGKADPAFPSVFMNIWDNMLRETNIMLIICGSLIQMMTSQVLRYDSPLYGRRTAQIQLKQIPFQYYHEFDETLTVEQQIERYAVTGGVPKYIELFEGNFRDIYEAIRENVLSRNAFLYAEPEFLLQKEVSEIGSYFSVLKTIANGNHKLSKIATALEVSQTSLSKYLSVLSELDIIERQVPVTEESPEKSKKGLYFMKDNYMKFWFRFVYRYKGILEAGQEEYVMEQLRRDFIDSHVAYVYEDICREDIWSLLQEDITFTRAGRWWGDKDVEIDIVAYHPEGNDMLFGECKYSVNKKGLDVLVALKEKAKHVSWKKENRREFYVIYSKSGFTEELMEFAAKNKNVYLKSLSS